jgi:hypothetical protein
MQQITWKAADIQRVNNYLIIKGSQILKSNHHPDSVYRACYALPSKPDRMDEWVCTHLDENEAQILYDFIFS